MVKALRMAFNKWQEFMFLAHKDYTVANKHVYRGFSHAKDEKMITKTNRN